MTDMMTSFTNNFFERETKSKSKSTRWLRIIRLQYIQYCSSILLERCQHMMSVAHDLVVCLPIFNFQFQFQFSISISIHVSTNSNCSTVLYYCLYCSTHLYWSARSTRNKHDSKLFIFLNGYFTSFLCARPI
jgi:hypothetical protein